MNRALAAILAITITPFVGAASAQSYAESNSRDTVCEWQFKNKHGIDKCHIIAMGSHGTSTSVLMFTVDNMVVSLTEEDGKKLAEIGKGDFWHFKAKWRGTYKDSFFSIDNQENGVLSVNSIRLSNGYTIKLVY